MNSLPISLLFSIEHRVLVLGQHLGLRRHRLLPRLESLEGLALFRKRAVEGRHYGVNAP